MEKKRVVPLWVTVILTLMCLASIAFYIIQIKTSLGMELVPQLLNIASIIAVVFALIYCIGGYKKSGALYFKLFCSVNAIVLLVYLLFSIMLFSGMFVDGLYIFLALIELMVFCVFFIEPNMGKKKSLTLAVVLNAATAAETIVCAIVNQAHIANAFVGFVVTVIFFIMVYGKYKDKEARGTK